MKRKVILQGGKTFMVSLPIRWAKQVRVGKGDELECSTTPNQVCFSAKKEQVPQQIQVNLEGLSERAIRYILSGLHKSGYDEITAYFHNQENLEIIEDLVKNLYVGFAIVEQDDKKCVLKCISKELAGEFDTALRRAFLVTLSLGESMLEALNNSRFSQLKDLLRLEKTNNQLTSFCERLLNKNPGIAPEKHNFLYVIAWNIEKVCDDYKYICRELQDYKGKLSRPLLQATAEAQNLLRGYYELFYRFDITKLSRLNEKKEQIQDKLFAMKLSQKEHKISFYLLDAIFKLVEFSASMTAVRNEP